MFRNVGTIAAFICGGFLVALAAGVAPTIVPAAGALGVSVGAALLIGIGVYLWILMSIIINREAVRVVASSEGFEVTLRNKKVLYANWSDPAFALDLTRLERPKDPKPLIWLSWRMQGRMTATLITKAGEDVILRKASEHGIATETSTTGKAPSLYATTHLRAPSR